MVTQSLKLQEFPSKPLGGVFEKFLQVIRKEVKREYSKRKIGECIGVTNAGTLGDWIRSMCTFGFLEKSKPGFVYLTEFGSQFASEEDENTKTYCRQAFLSVPLFDHLNKRFDGFALDKEIRQELLDCGINQIYLTQVVRVFKHSADFVGLWDESKRNEVPPKAENSAEKLSDSDSLITTKDLAKCIRLYQDEAHLLSIESRNLWRKLILSVVRIRLESEESRNSN